MIQLKELRGRKGIKEAIIDLKKGGKLKVAVVHELVTPAGCWKDSRQGNTLILSRSWPARGMRGRRRTAIFGKQDHRELAVEHRRQRAEALFKIDLGKELRKSHENPAVKKLYDEYLGHPLSAKARALLHTSYSARVKPRPEGGSSMEHQEQKAGSTGLIHSTRPPS